MSPMDSLLSTSEAASELARRTAGVTTAIVTDVNDATGQGRVLVKFPWTGKNSAWAPVMTPMAGDQRGFYCPPEINDHVLVMFDHGRIDSPFVIGAVWSGRDKPPLPSGKKTTDVRILKSRSGHTITLDDTSGKEEVVLTHENGKTEIRMDARGEVTVKANKVKVGDRQTQCELGDATDAMLLGTTYRGAQQTMDNELVVKLNALMPLLSLAGAQLTAAAGPNSIPIVGGGIAAPLFGAAGAALTSAASIVTQLATAIQTFEAQAQRYLSQKCKLD
jgi:phage baseplate assembly protein gpV